MDNWKITESNFEPESYRYKETLFTTGNGYLGTRGSFEEGYLGDQAVTLIHGIFDDVLLATTELANTPNWLHLEISIGDDRFSMDSGRLISYHRELNLHDGILSRQVRWQSPSGKTVELHFERFASLANEHLAIVRLRALPLNFDGVLEFRADLPGYVDNQGKVHWNRLDQGVINPQSVFLHLQTKSTKIDLCEACHLELSGGEGTDYEVWDANWVPTVVAAVHVKKGEQITLEKRVTIFSSRDTKSPKQAALNELSKVNKLVYNQLRTNHHAAWEKEWRTANITIEGDESADLALRYNLFQLLIAAPRHEDRVSIPAKSLSGFGYHGHVFWDTEIFILPFFIYTQPEIARNLLSFRFHTLPEALKKAQQKGYQGALFAWESSTTGEETTPRWVPGPDSNLVRIWSGDIEHHISADVAYAVAQYWHASGDKKFMLEYGSEILLQTAKFWGSRAEWIAEKECYEITNVIGPDEYHEHVDNSAYTNNLARWNLRAGLQTLDWLEATDPARAKSLKKKLGLSPDCLSHWQEVISKLRLGYNPQSRLIEQFEGFFQLKHVDLQEFEPRQRSMQALLGIEELQNYQIIKQPDVVMMLYLLDKDYNRHDLLANLDYYTPRTDLAHGSSLGPAIQALMAARSGDLKSAYHYFMDAAYTDLENNRGNTLDGIHAAGAGGLWQAVVFGFGGLKVDDQGLIARPQLPPSWKRLKFRIQHRERIYEFDMTHDTGETVLPKRVDDARAISKLERKGQIQIRGAIFDVDGVLTDTSDMHYRAWKRLADEEGIPFDRKANEALRGVSRRESLLRLLNGREVSEEKLQEMMDRKNSYYQEYIKDLSPEHLYPGARRFLEETRAAGVKIAFGSASKNARVVIKKLGIDDLADAISDGYSVKRQKPEPDLFLHAAAQLRLLHDQCVVFEDAESGVAAALAGCMWAVGIGPEERVGAAHVVLPNLEGISWDELTARLAQS